MTTKRIQQTQQGVQIFLTFRKSYTDIDKINLANMVQKVMDEIIGHFFANVYRKIKARDLQKITEPLLHRKTQKKYCKTTLSLLDLTKPSCPLGYQLFFYPYLQ